MLIKYNRGPKGQTARKGGAQSQRPKGGNSHGGRAAEGLRTLWWTLVCPFCASKIGKEANDMKSKYVCSILIFFLLLSAKAIFALNVPLTVTDYAGIDRIDEPVTSGVPLPKEANITSINQLQITDSQGNPIPAQFTVLSRWNGTPDDISKPIKWVLLDFEANVPANGTVVYYLKDTTNGGNTQNTNLSIQEDTDKIIVNTGKAKFQISKHYFNLFDYVWVDKDNDGQIDDLVLSQPNTGGLVLTGANGKKFYTILEPPEEILIEEQGPMRSVIKIRGIFKAQDGTYFAPSITDPSQATKENIKNLGYTLPSAFKENRFSQPYPHSIVYYNCRIYFYNNKDYVKVFLTLENNGANGRTNPEQNYAPIQIVYFDSVNLILKPNAFSQVNVISEDSSAQLTSSDTFILYQDWHENLTDSYKDTLEPTFEKGIYYFTKKNEEQLSFGKTNPGWIDLNSNSQGIGLAIRHFWQNFPKKITVTPAEIKIGLWPEEGYYPYCQSADFPDPKYNIYCKKAGRDAGVYLFDAGRHKTYEMFLRFYSGDQNYQTQYLSKALDKPLMALAPSEWYAQTKALGMIAPYGLTSTDPEINEAMQRFEKLQSAMVYEEDSENGWTILNIKTKNPPHWEFTRQNRFFGWMNFGDLLWSEQQPSALHYDWTYSMLLHYIRTGKRKFFDAGVEMVKHRYDVDQYHGERTDSNGNHRYINYFQFYESSGHADLNFHPTHPSKVSGPTHTWNGGLILYYLLTGDKLAWEAAKENGEAILNYYGPQGVWYSETPQCIPTGEIRNQGWSVVNLINLYRVTGNIEYLNISKNIIKNLLIYSEQQNGGQGYWGNNFSLYADICKEKNFCNLCTNYQKTLLLCYITEALINAHYETQDEDIKQLIIRVTNFLKDQALFGGILDGNGNYEPLQVTYVWVEGDKDGSLRLSQLNPTDPNYWQLKIMAQGSIIFDVFWADLFAYTYQITKNSIYLDWARKLFRDAMFYYTVSGQTYVNSNYRAKISYIDGYFPNTHTKAHGWIGRTNQVYLYTEWQLQQGELKIITTSLPNATKGQYYSYPISTAGGNPPYTFSLISGSLPNGISLSSNGTLSGTPTQAGTFTFTIQVKDSNNNTSTKEFTLTINPAQLIGDLNQDNKVNSQDFQILIQKFKETQNIEIEDLNSDGIVDVKDIGILMHYWNP